MSSISAITAAAWGATPAQGLPQPQSSLGTSYLASQHASLPRTLAHTYLLPGGSVSKPKNGTVGFEVLQLKIVIDKILAVPEVENCQKSIKINVLDEHLHSGCRGEGQRAGDPTVPGPQTIWKNKRLEDLVRHMIEPSSLASWPMSLLQHSLGHPLIIIR